MSSSFPTLEEGMRIVLDLLFLQEPFAFPTSCSLQLHWCWAMRRTQLSTKGLQSAGLGLTRQSGGGVTPDRRGSVERLFCFPEPLLPSPGCKAQNPESEERGAWAGLRVSLAQFLSRLLGSQAGLDFQVHPFLL